MRFAIEDARDIDRPEFHHAPTLAAALRMAVDLYETGSAPDAIIDLKTRKNVATMSPSWNRSTINVVIGNVRGRLVDIAYGFVRDSVGPRYQQID